MLLHLILKLKFLSILLIDLCSTIKLQKISKTILAFLQMVDHMPLNFINLISGQTSSFAGSIDTAFAGIATNQLELSKSIWV